MAKNKPPIDETKLKDEDLAQSWLQKIETSKSWQKKWKDRADKVVKRYRDEQWDVQDQAANRDSKFNILYANTQVLEGVVYQRTPIPDVRQRYKKDDPVGRVAAQVLERALSYDIDSYDFDGTMKSNVEDVLLPGRSVSRVKYKPTIIEVEGVEQVVYEEAPCDYVEWDQFLHEPSRRWTKVTWVAFGELLTKDDLVTQFGKLGAKVPLNWAPDGIRDRESPDVDLTLRRAQLWSIWDKKTKEVIVVAEGFDSILKRIDDPLKLENFFPCPQPMLSVYTNNSLIPIPEYCIYQDQAEELDRITSRITNIIEALRRRGVYDASMPELSEYANAGDNQFIPVQNYSSFLDKGGMKNAFGIEDLKPYSDVLVNLYNQREQIKTIIYEVTGISDILRGATNANETLGAQQIKEKYGSVRVQWRQKAIQKFARDILRLKAEIIAEHFSAETLKAMTGIDLPTNEQKQMIQMQIQQSQQMVQPGQSPQPPDPKMVETLNTPSWEDVIELLRNEKLRSFRIDIETDSTISLNDEYEKEGITEFMTAFGQMTSQLGPATEQGFMSPEVAKKIMLYVMRKFRVTKDVEDSLQAMNAQPKPQEQDPAAMAKVQVEQQKLQMEGQKMQAEGQKAQMDMQLEQAKLQQDMQVEQAKLQLEGQKAQLDAQTSIQVAQIQAENQLKIEQMKIQAADVQNQRELMMQAQLAERDGEKEQETMSKNHESMVNDVKSVISETKQMKGMEKLTGTLEELVSKIGEPRKVVRGKNGEVTGTVSGN